jgi:hypothetical protein
VSSGRKSDVSMRTPGEVSIDFSITSAAVAGVGMRARSEKARMATRIFIV